MPLSTTELEDLCRREKDAEQRDRLRAILMGLQGFASDEVATRIGRSQRFVQKWAAIYQAGGIEAIQRRKAPGAKSKLSEEEESRFSGEIMAVLRAQGRVRGKAVVEMLRMQFGQEYSLQGAYELMHRLGLPIRHPRLQQDRARGGADAGARRSAGVRSGAEWGQAPVPVPAAAEESQSGPGGAGKGVPPAMAPHLLAAVVESVGDGVLVVDMAGRALLWNARFLELWDIDPALCAAQDNAGLLAGLLGKVRDPAVFVERTRNLESAPMQASFDELPLRDGRLLDRHSRPCMVGGQVAGRVWVFRDVTARMKADAASRTHELRHSQISAALEVLMGRMDALDPDDLRAMARAAAECLAHTLGVARAGVWFLADEDTRLRCDDLYDARLGEWAQPAVWLASQCPYYFAAMSRKRDVVAHDVASHPATAEMAASYFAPLGISSMLDAPIFREGRVVGVVRLEQAEAASRRFAGEDSLMAGMVAGLVARYLSETALRQVEGAQASARVHVRRKSGHASLRTPSTP